MPSRLDRRTFLSHTAATALTLSASGCLSAAGWATANGPRPLQLRVFTSDEAATYAAWCDALAPGAAEAGVAHFVDRYLAEPADESLLLLRYLATPPFDAFYRGGIAGVEQESRAHFGKGFVDLSSAQRNDVIEAAATGATHAWREPDPGFFYFVSRSDAVDVAYGTIEGFRRLGVPYLAHIRPRVPF